VETGHENERQNQTREGELVGKVHFKEDPWPLVAWGGGCQWGDSAGNVPNSRRLAKRRI
jgi:hypothetical protein